MYYLIYLKQRIISLAGIFLFKQAGKIVPVCLKKTLDKGKAGGSYYEDDLRQ
jgi:hypothetical protein